MKTMSIAALSLFALAGTAFAAPRETQTLAGPYDVFGTDVNADPFEPDARNSTLSATFTATGYNVVGVRIVLQLDYVDPFTYASDMTVRVTTPDGQDFDMVMSTFELDYDSYANMMCTYPIPEGATAAGTWTFQLWDTYLDSATNEADAIVSNFRVSLESDEAPTATHDFGVLNGTDASTTTEIGEGAVVWYKVALPEAADDGTGFWVDMNTFGSTVAAAYNTLANDTMMGLYDDQGGLIESRDDIGGGVYASGLTFGATTARTHDGPAEFAYDGRDGVLTAGTYYIAAGAYYLDFYDGIFNVDSTSDSAGGTLVVNVFSNFTGGPTACSVADVGVAGGGPGQDRFLDNNDFIAFINYFFALDAIADMGIAGGLPGSDGVWDNNDFIAFINYFFADAANCTG